MSSNANSQKSERNVFTPRSPTIVFDSGSRLPTRPNNSVVLRNHMMTDPRDDFLSLWPRPLTARPTPTRSNIPSKHVSSFTLHTVNSGWHEHVYRQINLLHTLPYNVCYFVLWSVWFTCTPWISQINLLGGGTDLCFLFCVIVVLTRSPGMRWQDLRGDVE